jgi:hypothetical protein
MVPSRPSIKQETSPKEEWQTVEIGQGNELSDKEPLLARQQNLSQPRRTETTPQSPPKKKESFFDSLARSISEGLTTAFNDVEVAVKSVVKEIDSIVKEDSAYPQETTSTVTNATSPDEHTTEKWRSLFNFSPSESLLCASACRAIIVGGFIEGTAWISTNYWCFSWDWHGQITKVIIPLTQVFRIATAFAELKNNQEVTVMSTVPSGQMPNVIQLFTTDGNIHQFYDFHTEFAKVLDIATRAVTTAKSTPPPQYIPFSVKK